MSEHPAPTVRQLAALAGVSRTTVSLALRNHPSLPADTRARIQKLAAAHGYKQDPVVSSLMAQLRTSRAKRSVERIAYFTTWDTRDGWRQPGNENNFFLGAVERAQKLGYELEHIWAREPGLTTRRLGKILHTRAIRGIVLAPFANPRSHITMDWQHFATAAISHTLVRPLVHRTSHGHYNGMFLALHHLRHHGYRRVGFATRLEQSERVNSSWLAALLVHQQSIPAENRVPALLAPVPAKAGMDAAAFKAWVREHKPDVVVSNLGDVLDLLADMKLRVPEDIGYASIDLVHKDSPWSGVDQQATEVGSAAVDLVVTQLQNNEFGLPAFAKTVTLDGIWREGNTLLKRRGVRAR
ncbi:MAG: substrate-binding domain-containing protein [Rariglobus sp.]|nr:LacI family DNA-binding transcriptional regulator [Rariglobus sp.]